LGRPKLCGGDERGCFFGEGGKGGGDHEERKDMRVRAKGGGRKGGERNTRGRQIVGKRECCGPGKTLLA